MIVMRSRLAKRALHDHRFHQHSFQSCCYPATCPVTTFFFHYNAGDQGLIMNEWKNASSDRGGNHGDIRSANLSKHLTGIDNSPFFSTERYASGVNGSP